MRDAYPSGENLGFHQQARSPEIVIVVAVDKDSSVRLYAGLMNSPGDCMLSVWMGENNATGIPLTVVMRERFESIPPDTPLESIFQRFAEDRCYDLVVVDPDGTFLGVITALDLLATVGPIVGVRSMKRASCIECLVKKGITTAADVMKRGHITISRERTIGDAMRIMEKNRHPDLFVVDGEGRVIGQIAVCDIIAHLRVVGHL